MSFKKIPPSWRLPAGVDGPLWQYTQTPRLAAEEDAYFADHPLFQADKLLLDERFLAPGRLVDLGSGTGRHALRFAARGFKVVAVDLSQPMLEVVRSKARSAGIDLLCVRANLCRLACFRDEVFDYALLMFSTLGMVRGPSSRRGVLAEAARILHHGGRLALHAHNLWLNLRNPQGRAWLGTQLSNAMLDRSQFGDRRMDYRGIAGMRVHLYRWGELRHELRRAGFQIDETVPLDETSSAPIRAPWLLPGFRAGGWIVFATRR
jgi:SAM-dependent methyltransferase